MMADVVAGIDIGGGRKGSHLVVMRETEILLSTHSGAPKELLRLCLQHDVKAVGIDAPCRWGLEGVGRHAEKELAKQRIWCFATPTQERAAANQSGFYDWMFNGAQVFNTFAPHFPLLEDMGLPAGRVSFETFPHAITCALLGRDMTSAKKKRTQRRELLAGLGVDVARLDSIDALDAALCALAAQHLLTGAATIYGNATTGLIVIPTRPPQVHTTACRQGPG